MRHDDDRPDRHGSRAARGGRRRGWRASFLEAAAAIRLVAGLGVEGDAHAGAQVTHRSRVARDPTQPNLRRVHMVQGELHDELRAAGFAIGPAEMGEDLTTRGIDVPPPHGSLGPV
jgi:hypothetical protein